MNNFRNFKKIFKFFFSKIDNYSFSGIKLKKKKKVQIKKIYIYILFFKI